MTNASGTTLAKNHVSQLLVVTNLAECQRGLHRKNANVFANLVSISLRLGGSSQQKSTKLFVHVQFVAERPCRMLVRNTSLF